MLKRAIAELEFWIPYGQTEIPVRISDSNFYRILEPPTPSKTNDIAATIGGALEKPVEGVYLKKMVKPGSTAGIVVDPIIPPEIRQQAIRSLSLRLGELGISEMRVFVRKRLSNVAAPIESVEEGPFKLLDPSQGLFMEVGKTSRGTPVSLEQELLSCGIRVSVSMVMPHFASGFSGGPEMILPGCSSIQAIARNRSLLLKGSLSNPLDPAENPILSDSIEACKLAGPFYSLAFVPDGRGGVESVFAGELESVFKQAVARYLQVHLVKMDRRTDIVLTSAGGLLGADLYHAVRVLSNVVQSVKRDGTIVLVAECSKGVGDSVFLDLAKRFRERKELAAELRYRFKLGGHVNIYLHDILEKYRVELVSVLPDLFVRDSFGLKSGRTASEAVQKAVRIEGKDSTILIVSRGDLTIPVFESS